MSSKNTDEDNNLHENNTAEQHTADQQRLFLALWPDQGLRRQIHTTTRDLPAKIGRRVAEDNLHITLVFLGDVDQAQRKTIEAIGDEIQADTQAGRFVLTLDRIGYWPRQHIAWLGCEQTSAPLLRLVESLRTALTSHGFSIDQRDYQTHVTLMRKVIRRIKPRSVTPIVWDIDSFCLVESTQKNGKAHYQILQTWVLL